MRRAWMCASLGLIAASAAHSWDNCSKRDLRAKSTDTLDLEPFSKEVRGQPAFYYHDPERSYVFFVKPEDVVAWVGSRGSLEPMLEWLKQDLPLREDTDLFRYSLRLREFSASEIEWMLANLLDQRRVMVDAWPVRGSLANYSTNEDQHDPMRIKRMFWKSRGADGRRYCREDGFEILTIVETIYD